MSHSKVLEDLLVSSHRLTRIAAQSTGSNVTSATWSTLSVLLTDGPRRNGDLARAARISQPGMTKLLQNLVEDEWVYRIADVDDSRAWLIAITPRGIAALAAWRVELAAAMEPVLSDLSPAEWRTLESAAKILAGRLESAVVAA